MTEPRFDAPLLALAHVFSFGEDQHMLTHLPKSSGKLEPTLVTNDK
jgi:hypothetical protein